MDNLFEIVVILLILLAPALEALFKKRRGKGPPGAEKPRGREGRGREGGRGLPGTSEERGAAADDLIPDDLWELVTGERRAGKEREKREEPWRPPPGAADASSRVGSPETGAPEAGTSEADEGVWISEPPTGVGPEAPEPVARYEARPEAETEEERARRLALREAGATGGRRAALLAGARSGALARRGRPPAEARPTHPLLGEVDRRGLRRAVLWREILGPPVSLRDDS